MKQKKPYSILLEFDSIKTYLMGSIDSKKNKISSSGNLKEKIKSVNLTNYLRGIKLFLEFSEKFNYPSEILDFWKQNRDNNSEITKFKTEIENFLIWLRKEKKLSSATSLSYQAQIRGFLTHNDISLKFRNYDIPSDKSKERNKLGITYTEMKEFASLVKSYITDFRLKFLIEFMGNGLGYREIATISFGTLRSKNYDEEYIPISEQRVKTGVPYVNFISPRLKPFILNYLRMNEDKEDSDLLFGDTDKAYQNLHRIYKRAYKKCVENHFPRWKKATKQIFTLHNFRSLFISASRKLRIDRVHEDLLTAHKSASRIDRAYDLVDDLLEDYKLIENELFSMNMDLTKQEIQKELMENLLDLINNKGKRTTIYRKYQENGIKETLDCQIVLFLEQFKFNIKKEIMDEIKLLLKNKNNL